MPLTHAVVSVAGPGRPVNEDSYLAEPSCGLFIVADGRGPDGQGALASRTACNTIRSKMSLGHRSGSVPSSLEAAMREAGRLIHRKASRDLELDGMVATAVAAVFEARRVTFCHVGDCRAYLYRAGRVQTATTDHTLAMEQVREGLVSREEARRSTDKQVILRALGAEERVIPDVTSFELCDDDVVLLCSDGLTDHVDDATLARVIESYGDSLDGLCAELASRAAHGGNRDDITILAIRVRMEQGSVSPGHRSGTRQRASAGVALAVGGVALAVGSVGYVLFGSSQPAMIATPRPATAATAVPSIPILPLPDQHTNPETGPPTTKTPTPTETFSPSPSETPVPAVHELVQQVVDEMHRVLALPPTERLAFLQTQTADNWGHGVLDNDTILPPFGPPVERARIRMRLWRGFKGAEYLIEIEAPPNLGAYLADINIHDGSCSVALSVAPPTRTPTATLSPTPSATITPYLSRPAPTDSPTAQAPPIQWLSPSPTANLPPHVAVERALREFIEGRLTRAIRACTGNEWRPLQALFSPQVAARQYPYQTGSELQRPVISSLQTILQRYVESPTPAQPVFLGVSGERMTEARARVIFAVRYELFRNGAWNPVWDLHDADIERYAGQYRVARIYRYQFGLDALPRMDVTP